MVHTITWIVIGLGYLVLGAWAYSEAYKAHRGPTQKRDWLDHV